MNHLTLFCHWIQSLFIFQNHFKRIKRNINDIYFLFNINFYLFRKNSINNFKTKRKSEPDVNCDNNEESMMLAVNENTSYTYRSSGRLKQTCIKTSEYERHENEKIEENVNQKHKIFICLHIR